MFKLDEKFLADLGLGGLPPARVQALLMKIRTELEVRVGEELMSGLSDELLDEFGLFVDHDEEGTAEWLDANSPDWRTNPVLPRGVKPNDPSDLAATLWLRIHRPDYPSVVADKLNDIKLELIECRDAIRAQYEGLSSVEEVTK